MKSYDLLLSKSCMLKCKMCHLWQHPEERGELSINEWETLIRDMIGIENGNPARLHFGGGEPFFKNGIVPLIKLAKSAGFEVRVTSNGYLINDRLASEIIDSGLDHISFSLDSLQPEVHDSLRGVSGTHKRVMQAIDFLSGKKTTKIPTIGVNCLISAINLDGLISMAEWVIHNDKVSGVIFQAVIQPFDTVPDDQWYRKDIFSGLWPKDIKKTQDVLDRLIDLKSKGNDKMSNPIDQLKAFKMYFSNPLEFIKKTACPMDNTSLLVNWLGQVYFCGMLPDIGNIREYPIGEILLSKMFKDRQREMGLCNRNCNNKVNCFFKKESIHYGD